MKTIITLIAGTLLISSFQAFSQDHEIQARIVDGSSWKPVSFVTVYSHSSEGVISDETGFFRFHFNEDQAFDSLHFSCIGYLSASVALNDIQKDALDTIILSPRLFILDEVQVESKNRKTPQSKQIIKEAIAAIPLNHPDFPVKYNGYYREYVKHNEDHINLIESIIELSDSGINTRDHFAAGLLFKRSSPDFETDPALMRAYDNVNKFVPYLWAPQITANELVLLRSHDPVRNFDQATLYHIDNLKSEFVKNHEFYPPRLTYLDDTAYYAISFMDKKPLKRGDKTIVTEGTIFIDANDYGIKKLSYAAFAQEGIERKKIFGLNLEYKRHRALYYLHYLSFNNLFMTRNFAISDAYVHEGRVDLTFNMAFDTSGLNMENFRVFEKDGELDIRNMEVIPDSNLIRLAVHSSEDIQSEHLGFEITNLTDLNCNPLEKAGFREYYQYRELFVRDFQTKNTLISNNLVDLLKPVFETRIFGEMTADTSWINTPLIEEDFNTNLVGLDNPVLRSGVENLLSRNEKIVNEMVYLHTDREVYAPADTIWFKAYIRDMERLDTSSLSQTLFVKILNERGGSVDEARYLIEDSNARGQFILDQKIKEGVYYITAYTSWMQNFDTDQLPVKQILIRKERRPGLQMELVLDRSVYFSGDTVKAVVHCFDEQNRDVEDIKYLYSVEAGKRNKIAGGRASTSREHQDTLKFIIPVQASGSPLFTIQGTHKRQVFDTLFRIPVIGDIHVDFFPEGGNYINGLKSTIAFKAQTLQGDPIHIKGEIVDREGRLIKSVSTEHDGMGAFTISTGRDQPLFMKLTDPPGFDTLYSLPAGLDQGWQLSGTSAGDEIILEVQRKDTPGDVALITLMIRGHLSHYQQIRVKKSERVHIPLKELPAGIGVVTLFDQNMNPRAERLFYLNPAGEVGFSMKSDHQTYVPRDKVTLEIRSTNQTLRCNGSYSLSVVDEQLGFTDFIREPNIRSTFLLTPEIKGSIHHPDYYMDLTRPGVPYHLDLLLMTQGWRNYSYVKESDWNQVQGPKNQETISGTLLRQPFGKEAVTSAGNINVFFGGNSFKIPVNQNGRFTFTPEYEMKYNSGILISAQTNPPSSYAILRVDEPEFHRNLSGYLKVLTDSVSRSTNIPLLPYRTVTDQFSLGLTYFQWIEEVEIVRERSHFDDDAYDAVLEDFILYNKRESGPEDVEGAIDLIGILYNMGVPVDYDPVNDVLKHLGYPQSTIGWVVDDSYYGTNYSFVQNFVPRSIEKLYLVKGFETQYYGPNMPEVVVSIKLKRFDPDDQDYDPFQSKFNIAPFEVSKEFYKPLYNTEERRGVMIPDLRKTIHWDPDLQIGKEGNVMVEFYNGDRYTNVKCILEGITDKGVPVHEEYHYNVSLSRD
ncbi:MAG: hypothetical protein R6W31_11610 [Bacteroidales bacterium]